VADVLLSCFETRSCCAFYSELGLRLIGRESVSTVDVRGHFYGLRFVFLCRAGAKAGRAGDFRICRGVAAGPWWLQPERSKRSGTHPFHWRKRRQHGHVMAFPRCFLLFFFFFFVRDRVRCGAEQLGRAGRMDYRQFSLEMIFYIQTWPVGSSLLIVDELFGQHDSNPLHGRKSECPTSGIPDRLHFGIGLISLGLGRMQIIWTRASGEDGLAVLSSKLIRVVFS